MVKKGEPLPINYLDIGVLLYGLFLVLRAIDDPARSITCVMWGGFVLSLVMAALILVRIAWRKGFRDIVDMLDKLKNVRNLPVSIVAGLGGLKAVEVSVMRGLSSLGHWLWAQIWPLSGESIKDYFADLLVSAGIIVAVFILMFLRAGIGMKQVIVEIGRRLCTLWLLLRLQRRSLTWDTARRYVAQAMLSVAGTAVLLAFLLGWILGMPDYFSFSLGLVWFAFLLMTWTRDTPLRVLFPVVLLFVLAAFIKGLHTPEGWVSWVLAALLYSYFLLMGRFFRIPYDLPYSPFGQNASPR